MPHRRRRVLSSISNNTTIMVILFFVFKQIIRRYWIFLYSSKIKKKWKLVREKEDNIQSKFVVVYFISLFLYSSKLMLEWSHSNVLVYKGGNKLYIYIYTPPLYIQRDIIINFSSKFYSHVLSFVSSRIDTYVNHIRHHKMYSFFVYLIEHYIYAFYYYPQQNNFLFICLESR